MSDKPSVLVGRKLPEAVEARLSRDYDGDCHLRDGAFVQLPGHCALATQIPVRAGLRLG